MRNENFINPDLNNRSPILDRAKLVNALSDGLKKYGHVCLFGPGGSGKTMAVEQYLKRFKDFAQKNVTYLYGYELDLDKSKLKDFRTALTNKRENLLIIDEFETIQSPIILEEVTERLKEGRKYKAKTIIITRRYLESITVENCLVINFGALTLSKKEIRELINRYFLNEDISSEKINTIETVLSELGSSPLAVQMALALIKQGDYTPEELKAALNSELTYKNKIIRNASLGNKIILSETPKIISDVRLLNQSLLDKISKNPKSVFDITPRQFEELTAELFEKKGYSVQLTKQTQDGGKDLIILEDKLLGNFLCYVECKQYAPDIPVGVRVVRELFGTMTADRATAGVIVTSSYFSPPAYNFTEKIKHQMNLIDYIKLNGLIDGLKSCQGPEKKIKDIRELNFQKLFY